MKLLGIDFETTGIVPSTDRVIEIGAILWDTDRKQPLVTMGQLIKHAPEEDVTLTKFIQDLTQIRPEHLRDCGVPPVEAFGTLLGLFSRCDFVVAHNGNDFDKPLFEAEINRLGLGEKAPQYRRPWLDTRTDVPYPRRMTEKNMGYLCTEHGVTNLFAHRAVFDVLAMLQLLLQYDISAVIARSRIPMILVKANVSFEERDRAKARGFYWEPAAKQWRKSIKECDLAVEQSEADFEISRV